IHKSMVKSHSEAMGAYRKSSGERHSLLRRMMPDWRLVTETLGHVAKSVESVIARALTIDRHMEEYEAIVRGEDRAVSVLSSSSIVYFFVSLLMASVEAGLAYMRELLLKDELATSALLRGDATDTMLSGHMWITTAAQMGMGFVLPFALVFVAIPLETFVHSLRTVVGLIAIGILRALALLLRVLGNAFRHVGGLAQRLYDLPLFVPLWIEMRMAATEPAGGAPGSRGPSGEGRSLRGARP